MSNVLVFALAGAFETQAFARPVKNRADKIRCQYDLFNRIFLLLEFLSQVVIISNSTNAVHVYTRE